ncbi:MAG TPA: aconitate hydratase AcnA [Chloroflexota bacterium]|nr:aconitate hydratase AcnA [Chloroflexota bacterium]
MTTSQNPFGARGTLSDGGWTATYYSLRALEREGMTRIDRLPFTVKVLLENVLRFAGNAHVEDADIQALAGWSAGSQSNEEIPFMPSRVLMQDLTGVPAVVDLAAMRSAVARMGGDPQLINPLVPAELVIDHSIQVDYFGSALAAAQNVVREYERNRERYMLLRWAQKAFDNFSVVPPSTGIVHQVNIEYLARVVQLRRQGDDVVAFPDTLVGTDSHTTMVNAMGVLGWGVGGIEAEAVLLGQPLYLLAPEVIGFGLHGQLPEGTTATDLVLMVTQMLRKHGVVGKFVEFYGRGLSQLTLADRATLSNMAPEYGATASTFPVDEQTLQYLRGTGRPAELISLVERYTKEQGMFRTDASPAPEFSEVLELDLSTVEPSLAGPRRPHDRVNLSQVSQSFRSAFPQRMVSAAGAAAGAAPSVFAPQSVDVDFGSLRATVSDGSVVIAAITSCTNTSNPTVMIGAGLLAKKAVERGLDVKPYVKTSLAPGSRVVMDYLKDADLLGYLEALRFHLVGFGCTTCIGNSGVGLASEALGDAVRESGLLASAVLSGNRNFEARIHPLVRAQYLASPPLVVAYALAGTVDIDLSREPIGNDPNGQPVYLRDIWPTAEEVRETLERVVKPELFQEAYAHVFDGDEAWQALPVPEEGAYEWDPASTYIQEPPFFQDLTPEPAPLQDIEAARVLVVLGDSVNTDGISPASAIPVDSPTGKYLIEHGVQPRDFNQYGARRGNHQVMMRGTFGNIRLRNELVGGKEGDWTVYFPTGEQMRIYDASQLYQAAHTPLLVIAGKEYGSGSSRDWAAKGTLLLGVKAVLVESFERIHRSNLVGMGVLPLEFRAGESRQSLGLDGTETYSLSGIAEGLTPRKELEVQVQRTDGSRFSFKVIARVDSQVDIEYLRNGGILHTVLRQMLSGKTGAATPV